MKKIYTWSNHDEYARYWTKESIEAEVYNVETEELCVEKMNIAEAYLSSSSNPSDLEIWDPPVIKEEISYDKGILKKGDFHFSAWVCGGYIVSQNMVDKIGDVLREYGQLFPLEVEDREDKLYRYWVTKEVPFKCVDKQRSKIYDDEYNLMLIEKLTLNKSCSNIPMIFRVSGEYRKTIFVTEDFIKLVKKNDLKGFKFEIDTSYEYANNYGPYILVG